MTRCSLWVAAATTMLWLSACSGGGGGSSIASSSSSSSSGGSSGGNNVLPVTVDAGPQALLSAGSESTNTLFATVTICTPGSTTACQAIDHVQVDTGSDGLRIINSALSGAAVPTALNDPTTGDRLLECVQFEDGYTWGSMAIADVQIAGRTVANVPVNIIGDPVAGATAPASCSTSLGQNLTSESTVVQFGANGVLGIGNYLQDCGAACESGAPPAGTYYVCPGGNCQSVLAAAQNQASNVVGSLAADNNGVIIDLPTVAEPGAATVAGNVYFGINTQSNNQLPGSAQLLILNPSGTYYGDLTSVFENQTLPSSFIDSGSNGYFFPDSGIPVCTDNTKAFTVPAVRRHFPQRPSPVRCRIRRALLRP